MLYLTLNLPKQDVPCCLDETLTDCGKYVNYEIPEVKREQALLRKEKAEFKALIRNIQEPSERAVETPTPAAPAIDPASTNSSNTNRAAKRHAAEEPPDVLGNKSNFMEALARLRTDIRQTALLI
ncbi:hypothetical protein MRX96_014664 [Rhipicephalus microplus]